MIQSDRLEDARSDLPVVLAIGVFDGLHLGHQAILRAARDEADRVGGRAWVLTFAPHPARLLRPNQAPLQLCTEAQRARLLHALRMDGCVLLPFTRALADLAPEDFWALLRNALPTLAGVAVGSNWRFGRQAAGDMDTLCTFGRRDHVRILVPDAVTDADEPVSSTRVRRAVQEGDMDLATRLLGRPYALEGEVVHGKKLGRTMGFPTLNVQIRNECLPPAGVFACRVTARGQTYSGAGYRPPGQAESNAHATLFEVHLLDFQGDLYGEVVEVSLIRRMRPPLPPDQVPDLTARIRADVDGIRAFFAD